VRLNRFVILAGLLFIAVQLANAQANLNRYTPLEQKGFATAQLLDTQKAQVAQLESAVRIFPMRTTGSGRASSSTLGCCSIRAMMA
jgi:multidrug resistance efflux pump